MRKTSVVGFGLFLFVGMSLGAAAWGTPVNLLSLQEGTIPIVIPKTYGGWYAESMLDDSPASGWACEEGNIKDNVFVFDMVETAVMDRFEFDNASVDAEGADAHNLTLSQQRAKSVAAYLVAGGIGTARLKSAGFGESKPVADNTTELGRAQNRRVELVRE